jgi:hypothetical protein
MNPRRTLLTALVAGASTLALPAVSQAASATVTGDDGVAQPLGAPLTIRNMSPVVALAFDAAERSYSVSVSGPVGAAAAAGTPCATTSAASPEPVEYQGNGTYTVTVRTSAEDSGCEALGAPQVFTFDVNAFTTVTAPGSPLLTRRPDESALLPYTFRVELNPGADGHHLFYAAGAGIGPDGALTGGGTEAFPAAATGEAAVTFPRPGTYTFVARAQDDGAAGGGATAWSAPVRVKVLSPFDFIAAPSFADARGPTYRITGAVRESTAKGKIRVTLAAGAKGRFHGLRTIKIGKDGRFSVRFTLRKRGRYRVRYRFAGSETVAAGYVTQGIRITRRLIR